MEDGELGRWRKALAVANDWFRRRGYRLTREVREDLAQETAFEMWRFMQRHGRTEPQPAVLVTIAFRQQCRALQGEGRRVDRVADGNCSEWPAASSLTEPVYCIGGSRVPRSFLLVQLDRALRQMQATNRQILLAFYEGFSCAEIGERFRLTEEAVKVRLHRSRERLKKRLEGSARAASPFEV